MTDATDLSQGCETGRHGDVGVDVDPQITNGSSGSDVVIADPDWCLGYQMLSSIRGAPEDLRLGSVEL